MVLNKAWLLITIPLAVIAIGVLSFTALSLLRLVRKSVVTSLPIQAQQEISFENAGTYAINLEGPMFGGGASGLNFSLSSVKSATSVSLQKILFKTKTSSFSRSRLELYSFDIPEAGKYVLRIDGTGLSSDYNNIAVVITRRFTTALVLHILALVGMGVVLIGSLVVTGLTLAGKALTPN